MTTDKGSILLVCGLLMFAWPPPRSKAQDVAGPFQLTMYTDIKSHSWREFDDGGEELLHESGPLFDLGVAPHFSFTRENRLCMESDMAVTFGKVDYDGFLQSPEGRTPYQTKTGYFAFRVTPGAGYVLSPAKRFELMPFIGFGFEYWDRDIDPGKQTGYDERYSVFYFLASVKGTYLVNSRWNFFLTTAMEVPMSITESVDLASRGQGGPSDLSLSPGISPRFRFEGGSSFYNAFVSIDLERWTLLRSEDSQGYHQPESTRTYVGIRLGYVLMM